MATEKVVIVPRRLGGRDGFVARSDRGQHVFLSREAHEVLIELRRGTDIRDISARLSIEPPEIDGVVDRMRRYGLLQGALVLESVDASRNARIGVFCVALAGAAAGVFVPWAWHDVVPFEARTQQAGGFPLGGTADDWLIWTVGVLLLILLHESGHLGACRFLGLRPGGVRFRRFGVLVSLVSNVSSAWMLGRFERASIAFAGPAVSFLCSAGLIAILVVWPYSAATAPIAALAGLSFMFGAFSLLPIPRLDEYHALTALLDRPNLHSHGLRDLRRLVRRQGNVTPAAVYSGASALLFGVGTVLVAWALVDAVRNGEWTRALLPAIGIVWMAADVARRLRGTRRHRTIPPAGLSSSPPAPIARRARAYFPARAWFAMTMGCAVAGTIAVGMRFASPPPSFVAHAPSGTKYFWNLAANHVEEPIPYSRNPPVGGPHSSVWADCAWHAGPVEAVQAVHSLEHGAVWVTFRESLPPSEQETLRRLTGPDVEVLVSPTPRQTAPVVATAWGLQLDASSATDPRLDQFVAAFEDGVQAPEHQEAC